MNFIKLALVSLFVLVSVQGFTQKISVAGQFGYASPTGDLFEDAEGENTISFGLFYNLDGLYHFDNKLAAGLTLEGNILFTSDGDLGIFGLSLYGVKGYYRFFESTVSPYATLSLGLSQLSTPDITVGGTTTKGENAFSLGVRPELGVELGGFILAASYFLPMEYEFTNLKGKAGALQFSAGYRFALEL